MTSPSVVDMTYAAMKRFLLVYFRKLAHAWRVRTIVGKAVMGRLADDSNKTYPSSNDHRMDYPEDDDVPLKPLHDGTTPEGGYGWVIVAASFYASFTVFGICNTFGVMFNDIKDEYGHGQENLVFKTCMLFLFLVLRCILQTAHSRANTGVV